MNDSAQGPFALCEYYIDGTIFPVQYDIQDIAAAQKALAWQRVGQGQFEDWRIVRMADVPVSKLIISAFTKEHQAEVILAFEKAGAKP